MRSTLPRGRSVRLGAFMTGGYDELRKAVGRGNRIISLSGLTSAAAKAFVLTRLVADIGQTFAVVTESNNALEAWESDLKFFLAGEQKDVVSLPSFETDPYSGVSPHAETEERRALGLWQLARRSQT